MSKNLCTLQHIEKDQLIIEEALALCKKTGAAAYEVDFGKQTGFSVTVRKGEVETVEHNRDKSLNVTVYHGQAKGTASTTDTSSNALKETINAAYQIALATDADRYAALPEKDELAFQYPDLDLFYPWDLSVTHAIELAKTYEAAGLNFDKKISNSEGVTINTHENTHFHANSLGFVGYYPSTQHDVSCCFIATDGKSLERDYEYTLARDPSMLLPGVEIAEKAAIKTLQNLSPRKLATGKYPVIFSANIARGLLGNFIGAISGSRLYRQASFLCDHLEKPIFPEFITIDEQPHLHKAIGSAPFDSEGVKTRTNGFIAKGVLKSYVLGSYSARKLGLKTTGNAGGVHNLTVTTQVETQADLLKKMDKGLLITELMGQGVNLISGDYSRGARGFWVENGEIKYPVSEITIAGNLKDMFRYLVAIANDIDIRGSIRSGSILLEEMMVGGE